MTTFINPFSIDRAEQIGDDDLFKFYASHNKFEGLLRSKSLILEGGRGSGKTMFYLYHSYFVKKKEAINNDRSFVEFLSEEKLLGVYYRADSNFVPAFDKKGIDKEKWSQIFQHYLNLNISKRLLEVSIDIFNSLGLSLVLNQSDGLILSKILHIKECQKEFSFDDLHRDIELLEIDLINYINNISKYEEPYLIINGQLFNKITEIIVKEPKLSHLKVHVFIDEFENLLEYQQEIINTLIKHPSPIIIDLGMRNEGFKSFKTINNSEIINAPHDFSKFNFEDLNSSEYKELINNICKKRLQNIKELEGFKDQKYYDIDFYLGSYNDSYDLSEINKKYNEKILKEIVSRVPELKKDYVHLYNEKSLIKLRLIQVLLDRGKSISEISEIYSSKTNELRELLGNNKTGLIFLIKRENSKGKIYCGTNSFNQLSSGITRYFIELCEIAFRNAFRNNFSFSKPRPLTPIEQTDAVSYVSRYKINDIETYTPNGHKMKNFITLLGGLFSKFYLDQKLSEPERNHFTTEYDNLNDSTKSIFRYLVLYSILQKRNETKVKGGNIKSHIYEYHLNHIYCPYFQLSSRRMRSIKIKSEDVILMVEGNTKIADNIFKNETFMNIQQKFDF